MQEWENVLLNEVLVLWGFFECFIDNCRRLVNLYEDFLVQAFLWHCVNMVLQKSSEWSVKNYLSVWCYMLHCHETLGIFLYPHFLQISTSQLGSLREAGTFYNLCRETLQRRQLPEKNSVIPSCNAWALWVLPWVNSVGIYSLQTSSWKNAFSKF